MKTGRNDPCPCGSGKKYKKCCLENDESIELQSSLFERESRYKPEVDEWQPEDKPEFKDWLDDLDDEYDENNFEDDDEEDEDFDDDDEECDDLKSLKTVDDSENLTEMSEEDEKLVDDWWNEYKEMNDTVTEREHLVAFINQYPHLVDHLGLYHEVLFELGGKHFEKGIYETFVELLLRIRREYPYTYKQSYGWYDHDLICWFAVKGQFDELAEYFELFKRDIDNMYTHKLDEIVDFFLAINHPGVVLSALEKSTCHGDITNVIVNRTVSKYLDIPVTQESVCSLMDELISNGVELEPESDENFWRDKLLGYLRPFTVWDTGLPMKRSEAVKKYYDITNNFAYFLYQKTGLSFESAEYYSDAVYQYYLSVVSKLKRPENIFCLDMKIFEKNSYLKTHPWLDHEVNYLAQLNALYCFVIYLRACGNITETEERDFQEQIVKVYNCFYSEFENSGPEMLSFKKFPLWEIKS